MTKNQEVDADDKRFPALPPPSGLSTARLVASLFGAPLRRFSVYGVNPYRPQLHHFWRAGRTAGFDPGAILSNLGLNDETERSSLTAEFTGLLTMISGRINKGGGLSAPMAISQAAAFLQYALVRKRQPSCVVETGVATGVSTFFLLHALKRNGHGHLVSFDINPRAGALLTAEEKVPWKFVALPRSGARRDFSSEIERQGRIEFFVHDSIHSYVHQNFEFETVLPFMPDRSLLCSDDADYSFAFLDFCAQNRLTADYLITPVNVFGVAEVRVARD